MAERILLVEDDPVFRSVLEDNLVYEGYRVDAVADGNAALLHVRASKPDLIVLDLTLPDWDGLELCPLLHQGGKVPIIILSARGQKHDKITGLDLGADDYITKPTDLEELIARIRAVLRRNHVTLDRLTVARAGEEIRIEAAARSFLHNQVRILAGTLKLVGEGKWSESDVAAALSAKDRTRAGPTAPPEGLCLMEVRYDGAANGGSAGNLGDAEDTVDEQ